jgi:hypothetical protein
LLEHGFKIDMIADLVRDGLATAHRETMWAGRRKIKVARVRITSWRDGRSTPESGRAGRRRWLRPWARNGREQLQQILGNGISRDRPIVVKDIAINPLP